MHRWLLLAPAFALFGCASQPQHARAHVGKWEFPAPETIVVEENPIPQVSPTYEYRAELSPRDLPAALRFLEALVELERIRRAHPERYEATFNEAILIHEYGVLVDPKFGEHVFLAARRLYREFIEQAQGDPDAHDRVAIAKQRLGDFESIFECHFTKETEAERKRREQEEKQRAAQDEIERGNDDDVQRNANKPSLP